MAIHTDRCLICQVVPRDGYGVYQVCEICRGRFRADLADIKDLYERIGDAMEPGSAAGPKVSGSRTPPIPASLEALSLRGPTSPYWPSRYRLELAGLDTSHLADQHGALPVIGVLRSVQYRWREALGWPLVPPRGSVDAAIVATVRWLHQYLDRACDEVDGIVETIRDVQALRRHMRSVAGETPHMVKLGPCPTVMDDGGSCGEQLRADPHGDEVRCSQCGTVWTRTMWLRLGLLMRADSESATG